MVYTNFDDAITRKHGIVVEGWPLRRFVCPSQVGSQMELEFLLNSWQKGTTRFRKMTNSEHMAWIESRASQLEHPASNDTANIQNVQPAEPPSQPHSEDVSLASATNPPTHDSPFNVIHFGSPAPTQTTSSQATGMVKKPRKTRSDKGKPRKKPTQVPGTAVFRPGTQ